MRTKISRKRYRRRMSGGNVISAAIGFVIDHKLFFIIGAAAAAVVVVLFVTGVFGGGKADEVSTEMTQEEQEALDSELDAEMLGGLTGEDDSLFSSGDVTETGNIIGMTVLGQSGGNEKLFAAAEKAAGEDIKSDKLSNYLMYDAKGNENQQVQDVLSMINKGVKVVIVVDTDEYNFQKISLLCRQNGVKVVGYNLDATEGFDVNVVDMASADASSFAQWIKSAGAAETYTVGAAESELAAVEGILPVTANVGSDGATANIAEKLKNGDPIANLVVMENSANSILKAFIKTGSTPKLIASKAYAGLIKTAYQLYNGGIVLKEKDDEGVEKDVSPLVNANPATLKFYFGLESDNSGAALYDIAFALLDGRELKQPASVFALDGKTFKTEADLAELYQMAQSLEDKELLYVTKEYSIDSLFN